METVWKHMNFIFIVLLPVYQIIFLNSYAEHTRKWIDAYQMRNEEGEMESKRSLRRRIYMYLPEINPKGTKWKRTENFMMQNISGR